MDVSPAEESTATAAAVPASNALPLNVPGEVEDEEEWEYEYSNTETETYYLPIDFSIPQFSRRYRHVPSMTRGGGHYRNWTGLEHQKRPEMKHHRLHSEDDDNYDNDDDVPLPESEDDEEGDDTVSGAAGKGPGDQDNDDDNGDDNEGPDLDEIQILDLHSDKPLFRYRKRIFEGSWSRILGTELLFAERSPQDNPDPRTRPLPSLRSLPGDIDLLAACWSHITTNEVELHPRQKQESPLREDPYLDVKREHRIQIPIWSDKTGERSDQTRFLEDLMALKLKKGESDAVTVYAQAPEGTDRIPAVPRSRGRSGRTGAGSLVPRRRRGRGGARELLGLTGTGEPVPDERKRRQSQADGRPTKMRRPYGTGPRAMMSRARAGLAARSARAGSYGSVDETSSSDEDAMVLSQPTPNKWSDLGRRAHHGDVTNEYPDEEDDEDDEDEDDEDEDDEDEEDDDDLDDEVMANAT